MSLTKKRLVIAVWAPDGGKGHTIHYRESGVNELPGSPWLEETEMEFIEREVRNRRRFRYRAFPQTFPSKTGKEGHTGLQRKTNREIYPECELYEGQRSKAGGDPQIFPRDSIYPEHVMRAIGNKDSRSCDEPQCDRYLGKQRGEREVKHVEP